MKKPVVCIGGSLVDENFYCLEKIIPGTSNPANFKRSAGGVCRNIAQHLAMLGHPVELLSIFGNDPEGVWMKQQCENTGISLKYSAVMEGNTGRFAAVLEPDGSLFAGVMVNELEPYLNHHFLEQRTELLKSASLIITDTNMAPESLQWLFNFASQHNVPCIVEPVSVAKARKLSELNIADLFMVTPNADELASIQYNTAEKTVDEAADAIMLRGVQHIWLRRGELGSMMIYTGNKINLQAPTVNVIDTTGAGDAALAGWVHGYLNNNSLLNCMQYGHSLAAMVLGQKGAVLQQLNAAMLDHSKQQHYPDDKM